MITKAKTSYKSWPGYIVQDLFARTIPNSKGRLSRVCRLNLLSVHLKCTSARSGHGMRSSHRIKLRWISCPRSGWASFAHTQSLTRHTFFFAFSMDICLSNTHNLSMHTYFAFSEKRMPRETVRVRKTDTRPARPGKQLNESRFSYTELQCLHYFEHI